MAVVSAKKTGLVGFVPIAVPAARRKRVGIDRNAVLAAYRDKTSFQAWKEGFLETSICLTPSSLSY